MVNLPSVALEKGSDIEIVLKRTSSVLSHLAEACRFQAGVLKHSET
jgi:hypothetical protein